MQPEEIQKRTIALVEVAMGRSPADLVIRDGQWVCVQSGEIIPYSDIAVKGKFIAFVGPDASHTIGESTRIIEANGRYLVPGLLDAHMHVESGMLTVTEFVRAVVPHGTTAMFVDPHEMANIFGLKGVRLMVEEAADQPVHVWVQMPSCIPSAPGFETPGGKIGPEEVAEAMRMPGIIGLGEMMDFPGVVRGDPKKHAEMAETRAAGKVIGGHYASPDLGLPFHAYAAGGPQDDHEGTRLEDAVARVRQGMKAMLRQGSGWLDVASQIKAVTELGLDPRGFILCTDDSHCGTLVNEGHVNRAVKVAIAEGLNPLTAIQMATINAAEYFHLAHEIGQIAPGRYADILLVKDLENISPDLVIAQGTLAAENGKFLLNLPEYSYPDWAIHSVHVPRKLTAADFCLPAPEGSKQGDTLQANVIGVIENQAPTQKLQFPVQVQGSEVRTDIERDIIKIAVIERHQDTGRIQLGLVHGFGFNTDCAVATTVAHDSHHLIVAGTNESDMALAANTLIEKGGGQSVVRQGEVIGLVELPIGGLMSNIHAEVVAQKASTILDGFKACGCMLNNPNMQLSLLGLVVIPELRISDLGLVDVTQFEFVPLFEKERE